MTAVRGPVARGNPRDPAPSVLSANFWGEPGLSRPAPLLRSHQPRERGLVCSRRARGGRPSPGLAGGAPQNRAALGARLHCRDLHCELVNPERGAREGGGGRENSGASNRNRRFAFKPVFLRDAHEPGSRCKCGSTRRSWAAGSPDPPPGAARHVLDGVREERVGGLSLRASVAPGLGLRGSGAPWKTGPRGQGRGEGGWESPSPSRSRGSLSSSPGDRPEDRTRLAPLDDPCTFHPQGGRFRAPTPPPPRCRQRSWSGPRVSVGPRRPESPQDQCHPATCGQGQDADPAARSGRCERTGAAWPEDPRHTGRGGSRGRAAGVPGS